MKTLVVIGTRPEAIKMAPVIKDLKCRKGLFDVSVCLTAQHRDLLDQVVEIFGINIDYDLNLMRPDQGIFEVTAKVLLGMKSVLDEARPDVMLVHGDTTTSFAAGLAGYYQRINVGHVEAGLRTFDKYQPFPEEMNRRMVDALCDFHYAPTPQARENLIKENIPEDRIIVTGNTAIDALLDAAAQPYEFADPLLDHAGRERRLLLVTAHRRESFGEPFMQMCTAIRELAETNHDVEIIYPVHPNPNVRKAVNEVLLDRERVYLVEPLDYITFVHLLKKATIVLTDSGGIQEEAPSLGKPVLVMREVTERPEGVEAGTAMLVGTSRKRIVNAVQRLLDDQNVYKGMANAVNPYGDGLASKRIGDHLESIAKGLP